MDEDEALGSFYGSFNFVQFCINEFLDIGKITILGLHTVAINKYSWSASDTCLASHCNVFFYVHIGFPCFSVLVKGGNIKTKVFSKLLVLGRCQGVVIGVEQVMELPKFSLFVGGYGGTGGCLGLFMKGEGKMFENYFNGIWIMLEHLLE